MSCIHLLVMYNVPDENLYVHESERGCMLHEYCYQGTSSSMFTPCNSVLIRAMSSGDKDFD